MLIMALWLEFVRDARAGCRVALGEAQLRSVSAGAILGAYLWKLGPGLNFLGAAAIGAAGTIFYVKTIRRSQRLGLNDLKKQLEMRRTRL